MTLIYIGFGLMTVAAVVLYIANRRLSKTLKNVETTRDNQHALINKMLDESIDRSLSLDSKAEVEETHALFPYFMVYRKGKSRKHIVARLFYNPKDPDDREYKRVCAEEIADVLNGNL